jgi:hypothetical protein
MLDLDGNHLDLQGASYAVQVMQADCPVGWAEAPPPKETVKPQATAPEAMPPKEIAKHPTSMPGDFEPPPKTAPKTAPKARAAHNKVEKKTKRHK